jgi:hypothetical protein
MRSGRLRVRKFGTFAQWQIMEGRHSANRCAVEGFRFVSIKAPTQTERRGSAAQIQGDDKKLTPFATILADRLL